MLNFTQTQAYSYVHDEGKGDAICKCINIHSYIDVRWRNKGGGSICKFFFSNYQEYNRRNIPYKCFFFFNVCEVCNIQLTVRFILRKTVMVVNFQFFQEQNLYLNILEGTKHTFHVYMVFSTRLSINEEPTLQALINVDPLWKKKISSKQTWIIFKLNFRRLWNHCFKFQNDIWCHFFLNKIIIDNIVQSLSCSFTHMYVSWLNILSLYYAWATFLSRIRSLATR